MQYYASEAYKCDVTIDFPPTPSWFVYNVFNAQPSLLTLQKFAVILTELENILHN